jgi:plasmid maintenance system antidote protein VapI
MVIYNLDFQYGPYVLPELIHPGIIIKEMFINKYHYSSTKEFSKVLNISESKLVKILNGTSDITKSFARKLSSIDKLFTEKQLIDMQDNYNRSIFK